MILGWQIVSNRHDDLHTCSLRLLPFSLHRSISQRRDSEEPHGSYSHRPLTLTKKISCLNLGGTMEQILGVADWRSFALTANSAFLLAFPSLFSIINPVGGALIFYGFTKDFRSSDRVKVAARVGFYSLLIMFGALW